MTVLVIPQLEPQSGVELPRRQDQLNNNPKLNGASGEDAPWPEPDMGVLHDKSVPAPVFDWEAVSPSWQEWIRGACQDTNAPPDYIYANLLVTAAGVIGNSRRASPSPSWVEPTTLWGALVGNPSSMKTPSQKPFKNAIDALEMTRDKQTNGSARLQVADATIEAIAPLLSKNQRGLIIIRPELAGLIGQFGRYNGGAGGDRAFYLESYDGGSYTVDRVGKAEPIHVPFATLSITGALQPDKLRKLWCDDDDGFVARFIFVWPDPIAPRRLTVNNDGSAAREQTLYESLGRLRALPVEIQSGRLTPKKVGFDADALELLHAYRNEVFEQNKFDEGIMAGWRGKNPGRASRLGLVIEYLNWARLDPAHEPSLVSAESTYRAVMYLGYATKMMHRALGELGVPEAQRIAARLAHTISTGKQRLINEREQSQTAGFHRLRDKNLRGKVLKLLEDGGWIRRAASSTGHRPRGDWDVNPKLAESSHGVGRA